MMTIVVINPKIEDINNHVMFLNAFFPEEFWIPKRVNRANIIPPKTKRIPVMMVILRARIRYNTNFQRKVGKTTEKINKQKQKERKTKERRNKTHASWREELSG